MAYAYCADVYCDDCGQEIINDCPEDTGDTNEFPQYFDEQFEESDYPNHCGDCGEFLGNPLTTDGYDYVKEAVSEGGEVATEIWAPYYGIEL